MPDWDVVVVGAGAAGLLAAARAAQRKRRTLLLEKNRKPGVKILMSGGTRCNLTHATDAKGIIRAYGPPGRFLHSALAGLGPQDLVRLFETEGVPTKVEETGKIFPTSDKATDVLAALVRMLQRSGAELSMEEPLEDLRPNDGGGLRLATPRRALTAGKVILTTGGKSYPGCGTTGDGYRWTAAMGHTLVPPRPALVPVKTDASWVPGLKGITIPDVLVRVVPAEDTSPKRQGGPREPAVPKRSVLAERRSSFLFTHFGLSGPAVLDVSRAISGHDRPRTLDLVCDFLPQTSEEEFDRQLGDEVQSAGKRQVSTILAQWTVGRLAEVLVALAGIPSERRAADLSKAERQRLVRAVKRLAIPVAGTLGFEKAEVTAGGVALDEVDSRTLQSKVVADLYIAGELLDLDGPIGGYNFQAAFSTGWLAGSSV
ncbi:MAG: NAD(P)/FAD-dependent oxidoreductase [Pirellulales bacterium]|nr:NAD(P)/FAD-dependent oxidoreductase [Pirellulales bacterium]